MLALFEECKPGASSDRASHHEVDFEADQRWAGGAHLLGARDDPGDAEEEDDAHAAADVDDVLRAALLPPQLPTNMAN